MPNKLEDRKKVIVAMSGGVDSSVAAVLLKKAGFDVIGVFMKFWSSLRGSTQIYTDKKADLYRFENRCCSSEAENRARSVAEKLKIPFYVFNFEKDFRKKVVDYFLSELKAGRTPNPCVVCNKEIKLGLFIEKAMAMGADYVATGHYCKIKNPARIGYAEGVAGGQKSKIKIKESFRDDLYPLLNPPIRWSSDGRRGGGCLKSQESLGPERSEGSKILNYGYGLLKGRDENKDQSYFLWKLNQKQLSRILFPIGGYLKSEVREMARKFNLPTAEAAESQEICFVRSTMKDFCDINFKPRIGKIIDTKGNIIGEHLGLWFYTIGQRKGINIRDRVSDGLAGLPRRSRAKPVSVLAGFGEVKAVLPFYVLDKDVKKNILIVTQNEKDLFRKEMVARDVNWISGKGPEFPLKVKIKIRYRQEFCPAVIAKGIKQKEIKVVFASSQKAITSGQSAVFYRGEELLGGGIIK